MASLNITMKVDTNDKTAKLVILESDLRPVRMEAHYNQDDNTYDVYFGTSKLEAFSDFENAVGVLKKFLGENITNIVRDNMS